MRDAGFTKEQAATRLGHGDDGQLLDRVYDRGDRFVRARRALDEVASLREALAPAGAGRERRGDRHARFTSRPSRDRRLLTLGWSLEAAVLQQRRTGTNARVAKSLSLRGLCRWALLGSNQRLLRTPLFDPRAVSPHTQELRAHRVGA
jgi:hypothetical protein